MTDIKYFCLELRVERPLKLLLLDYVIPTNEAVIFRGITVCNHKTDSEICYVYVRWNNNKTHNAQITAQNLP